MTLTERACGDCDRVASPADKFCSRCGKPVTERKKLPYAGTLPTQGVYRITLVTEEEFRNKDHAEEVAARTTLYEGNRFKQQKVEFLRTTCGPEEYPFVCSHCRDHGKDEYMRKNAPVSQTDQAICEYCCKQSWERRQK